MKCEERTCQYADCYAPATEQYDEYKNIIYLCYKCSFKYDNSNDSGYCNQDCKLGHGCDESC